MNLLRQFVAGTVFSACVLVSPPSGAWEPTTQVGLAENAALASSLHSHLEKTLGIAGGLFARLIIPPQDAPKSFELLSRFNPTHGFVPDTRGRQTALAWIAAGAALADMPSRHAANHFLNPANNTGLRHGTADGFSDRIRHYLGAKRRRAKLPTSGVAADTWLVSQDNPLGLQGFIDQYSKSITAKTARERERHLAGALMAAGAIIHVVQDLASPSHAHVDLAAHLQVVGNDAQDVASRFERIAALAYGRLGVPAPTHVVNMPGLRDFLTNADGTGIADIVFAKYPSQYRLPPVARLPRSAQLSAVIEQIRRTLGIEDLGFDTSIRGSIRIHHADQSCVAIARHSNRDVELGMDDDCVLSRLTTLLPLAGAYGAGVLNHLFRGTLELRPRGTGWKIAGRLIGKGRLVVLGENIGGQRSTFHDVTTDQPSKVAIPAAPAGTVRVIAVFIGDDNQGEPIVAVGSAEP